jgi:hypothetical protein
MEYIDNSERFEISAEQIEYIKYHLLFILKKDTELEYRIVINSIAWVLDEVAK